MSAHRTRLKDGSSVFVEVDPPRSGRYKVTCYVLDVMLVSAYFTPGRGLHDGSVQTDEVAEAVRRKVERLHRAGKLGVEKVQATHGRA